MSELAAKRGAVPAAKKALFLVFRIGNERFALKATEVAEVLPRLTFGTSAQARTSTRLVLVNYQPQPWSEARWLGLILEQATDTLRCDPAEFQPYGLDNQQAPYLGPVREDAQGLMQWIGVADLLTAPVRALLFSAELSL